MSGPGTDDLRASFFAECEELLESVQDGFDRLEVDPQDADSMNAVFRAVHSIKGGAGAFGFDALVDFAHHFESALDRVRAGQCAAGSDLLDLFRQCGDALSDLVAAARNGESESGGVDGLLAQLDATVGLEKAETEKTPDFEPLAIDIGEDGTNDAEDPTRRYTIRFAAEPGLFASGNEPAVLFRALEKLGTLEVRADPSTVSPLAELDSRGCAITWDLTLATSAAEPEIREVFEFVETDCTLEIAVVDAAESLAPESPASGPDGAAGQTDETLPDLAELIEVPATAAASANTTEAAETPQRTPERSEDQAARARPGGTIRVDLDRIDRLINLVGELVIKEAMLSQSVSTCLEAGDGDLGVLLEGLRQLTGEIQEGVMAIRAQPVKPVFQRMARTVREAGTATGKPVRLVTDGEYTEVDKTVLERLIDPLTHMIRNAVDHGLESAEARAAAGKPAAGTVMLSAAHRSGRVLIDVADDGSGIDRDRVRALAIERGLISENDALTPDEIDNLLFAPGFSSKEAVSEMSGRGVGLDVVRSEIQALGGRVSIHSEPGEGTTFSISLPLTLAVVEGMLVEVAGQTMVAPISAIRETLQPAAAAIETLGAGGHVLHTRNGLVPLVDLGAVFGFRAPQDALDGHVLLVIEPDNGQRYALVVDGIRDQRQVVIKSLETNYQQIPGVAAATILGDGRIALIVDPDTILGSPGAPGADNFPLQMTV